MYIYVWFKKKNLYYNLEYSLLITYKIVFIIPNISREGIKYKLVI